MAAPDQQGLSYVATWLIANGTSIAVVWKWLTAPIHEKIATLEKVIEAKLATFDKRLEKLDGYVNPRASMVDGAPTVSELIRRVQELEAWRREYDEFRAEVVTDEEFRSYTTQFAGKIEKIVEALGWIKGRLLGKVEE